MKKLCVLSIVFALSAGELATAQSSRTALAPGALGQIDSLLEKAALVKPASASPLGKNWFKLESDAHIFTTEVSLRQVAAVLLDLAHLDKIYNGKKVKLSANITGTDGGATLADFVSVSVAGPFQIKTPYRAAVTTLANTEQVISIEVKQTDSATNNDIKNLYATRYAEEVSVGGKKYVYIRIYTLNDINASILPGAKGILENNAFSINEETLRLIISAAKTR